MRIKKNDKVFVLRYNDNFITDSMGLHKAICDELGYCWYGKAGKKPNVERIANYIEDGEPKILFYSRKARYIGNLTEFSVVAPEIGFPDYYGKSMWKPSSWFKVTGLEELESDILEKLVIDSTGKSMKETINSSMTSFYFTTAKEDLMPL